MDDNQPIQSAGLKVQILAYIDQLWGPRDVANVGDDFVPNMLIGYVCEVTVFIRVASGTSARHVLVDHYGDGTIKATYEAAQEFIRQTTGVTVERLAGSEAIELPKQGTVYRRVGRFVIEFEPNDTPIAKGEEDNPHPKMGPEMWRKDEGEIYFLGKKKKEPIQ